MNKFYVFAGLITFVCAGCSSESKPGASGSEVTPALSSVRAAIVAGNYSEAAQSAQGYIAAHPKDPEGYFEDARAEALAGNQGHAINSLGKAVDNGLANPSQSLNDPAFDDIRGEDRFAALAERANPVPHTADKPSVSADSGTDHVRITEHRGGTQIQAGDVKLNTNF